MTKIQTNEKYLLDMDDGISLDIGSSYTGKIYDYIKSDSRTSNNQYPEEINKILDVAKKHQTEVFELLKNEYPEEFI